MFSQPWVYAAVRTFYLAIARLPQKTYTGLTGDDRKRVRDHAVANLLRHPFPGGSRLRPQGRARLQPVQPGEPSRAQDPRRRARRSAGRAVADPVDVGAADHGRHRDARLQDLPGHRRAVHAPAQGRRAPQAHGRPLAARAAAPHARHRGRGDGLDQADARQRAQPARRLLDGQLAAGPHHPAAARRARGALQRPGRQDARDLRPGPRVPQHLAVGDRRRRGRDPQGVARRDRRLLRDPGADDRHSRPRHLLQHHRAPPLVLRRHGGAAPHVDRGRRAGPAHPARAGVEARRRLQRVRPGRDPQARPAAGGAVHHAPDLERDDVDERQPQAQAPGPDRRPGRPGEPVQPPARAGQPARPVRARRADRRPRRPRGRRHAAPGPPRPTKEGDQ